MFLAGCLLFTSPIPNEDNQTARPCAEIRHVRGWRKGEELEEITDDDFWLFIEIVILMGDLSLGRKQPFLSLYIYIHNMYNVKIN